MIEPLLILAIFLFIVALACFGLYHKKLRKVHYEYGEAKSVLNDIIISFNRQLKHLDEKVGYLTHRVEARLSREAHTIDKIEQHDAQLVEATAKITQLTKTMNTNVNQKQLEELSKKLDEIVVTQEKLQQRISEVTERKPTIALTETKIKAAIPIRRDKALAPLTPTELAVLEFLASEGAKTAPQIKEAIKLTREHTARLMKKLYEEGYLERDERKVPFTYRIKEEMQKILKKTEGKQA